MNFKSMFAGKVMGYKPSEQLEMDHNEDMFLLNNAINGSEDNVLQHQSPALMPSDKVLGGNLKDLFPQSNILGQKAKGMDSSSHIFNKKVKGLDSTKNAFPQLDMLKDKVKTMGINKHFNQKMKGKKSIEKLFKFETNVKNTMVKNPFMIGMNRVKMQKQLNMFGDHDGDKLPNILDCNPFDKNKQGAMHKLGNLLHGKGYMENAPASVGLGGQVPTYGHKPGMGQKVSTPMISAAKAIQAGGSAAGHWAGQKAIPGIGHELKDTVFESAKSAQASLPELRKELSMAGSGIQAGGSAAGHWAGQKAIPGIQAAGSAAGHWAGQKAIPGIGEGAKTIGSGIQAAGHWAGQKAIPGIGKGVKTIGSGIQSLGSAAGHFVGQKILPGIYRQTPLAIKQKEQELKLSVLDKMKEDVTKEGGKVDEDIQKKLLEKELGLGEPQSKDNETLKKILAGQEDTRSRIKRDEEVMGFGSGGYNKYGKYVGGGMDSQYQSPGDRFASQLGLGQGWSGQGAGIAQMSGQPSGIGFQQMSMIPQQSSAGFQQMSRLGVSGEGVAKEAMSDVGSGEGVLKEVSDVGFAKTTVDASKTIPQPTMQPTPQIVMTPTPQTQQQQQIQQMQQVPVVPAPVIYDVSARGQQPYGQPYGQQYGRGPQGGKGPKGSPPAGKPIWNYDTQKWVSYKRKKYSK